MTELEYARAFFENDRYASEATGIVIEEVRDGHSRVSLHLEDRHKNAMGGVMGAVFYTLVDFAFAVAGNYRNAPVVTLSSTIEYLKAPKGDTLYADCDRRGEGGHTLFYDVCITDSLGREAAHACTTGYKMKPRADEEALKTMEDPYGSLH